MDILLEFVAVPEWPSLAWLARCKPGNLTVTVLHGGSHREASELVLRGGMGE